MWGREMRAGLLFVLVSLAVGGGFRGWERAHRERFDEIVASLVEVGVHDEPAAAASDAASGTSAEGASAGPADSGSALIAQGAPPPPRGARGDAAQSPLPASIDVDRASAEAFIRLPGIGPALAARIVAEREHHGAFGGPEGLLRVHGIGPKTLEKIRPYLAPPARSSQ